MSEIEVTEALVPDRLVPITLVPVEVFGTDGCCQHGPDEDCDAKGYGICDAVSAWSDCNRAVGRIYRVEDVPEITRHREPGDTLTLLVTEEQAAWFKKKFGGDA